MDERSGAWEAGEEVGFVMASSEVSVKGSNGRSEPSFSSSSCSEPVDGRGGGEAGGDAGHVSAGAPGGGNGKAPLIAGASPE